MDLLLTEKESEESFKQLKEAGLLFTRAKTIEDFHTKKYAVRLAGKPPADKLKRNQITIGPFPVGKKQYFEIKNTLGYDKGTLRALLSFLKLQYEKIGTSDGDFKISVKEQKNLGPLMGVMNLFDIDNPHITEHYVWFFPEDEHREKIFPDDKKPDNYFWWNTVITLDKIKPDTVAEHKDKFIEIHNNVFLWGKYLPSKILLLMMDLYRKIGRGQQKSKEEVLEIIKDFYSKNKSNDQSSEIDRAFLLKELFDYNGLIYPYNNEAIINFLISIRMLNNNEDKISLNEKFPKPYKVLKLPEGWTKKAQKFVITGSVAFSYLDSNDLLN